MINAVFIDYMGATVDEHSPEMAEIVRRICKNSGVHDPKQVQRFILDNRRRYESDSYLESYLTEDEIVDRLISDMEAQIGLTEDPAILRDLIRRHWVNAPVFPDALRACLKSFDKNGGVGDNRKKQAGAGENASISK